MTRKLRNMSIKIFMYHFNVICILLMDDRNRLITRKIKRHISLAKRIESVNSEIYFVICQSKKDYLVALYKTYPRDNL